MFVEQYVPLAIKNFILIFERNFVLICFSHSTLSFNRLNLVTFNFGKLILSINICIFMYFTFDSSPVFGKCFLHYFVDKISFAAKLSLQVLQNLESVSQSQINFKNQWYNYL